jgi:hypothetical protein
MAPESGSVDLTTNAAAHTICIGSSLSDQLVQLSGQIGPVRFRSRPLWISLGRLDLYLRRDEQIAPHGGRLGESDFCLVGRLPIASRHWNEDQHPSRSRPAHQ